jgi:hypothetical protein
VGAVGAETSKAEPLDFARDLRRRLTGQRAAVFHKGHLGDDRDAGGGVAGGVYRFR